jgi:hypothetical protein
MSDFDRFTYRPHDTVEDIQFKLQDAQEQLEIERSKRLQDRAPLWEAYLENTIRVFERDIQHRLSQ